MPDANARARRHRRACRKKHLDFSSARKTRAHHRRIARAARMRRRGLPTLPARAIRRPTIGRKKFRAMARCTTRFAPNCANTGNESGRARRPDRDIDDVRDGARDACQWSSSSSSSA
jgi:hypothetical protein